MRRLLKIFFRLLYNEFAFLYDFVSGGVSIGQWRSWQRQVIPFIAGDKVLEIAHGTGDLQIDLGAAGYQAVGLDLSARMGRIARRKLAQRGLAARLARGSVVALPFPAGQFTTIVSTFPTEFIVNPLAVDEFWRVLGGGGRLVFIPSATILPAHWADRLARWLFEITGQSSTPPPFGSGWPPRIHSIYGCAGFEIAVERVPLLRSVVWVIVATKNAA